MHTQSCLLWRKTKCIFIINHNNNDHDIECISIDIALIVLTWFYDYLARIHESSTADSNIPSFIYFFLLNSWIKFLMFILCNIWFMFSGKIKYRQTSILKLLLDQNNKKNRNETIKNGFMTWAQLINIQQSLFFYL